MTPIDRHQLKRMIDENAVTLVEVLDAPYFKKFHLPGAMNGERQFRAGHSTVRAGRGNVRRRLLHGRGLRCIARGRSSDGRTGVRASLRL